MSTAATTTVTTFAGCLAQLDSLTSGIDMVPSRLCEEIRYVESVDRQEELPWLLEFDGKRTDVAEMFDAVFPKGVETEKGEVIRSSQASSFVGRVKALDAVLDRDVETVMIGLTNRPPDTFESFEKWREFDKFIIRAFGNERLRDTMRAEKTLKVMAVEAFTTARLADAENRPEAVANAFFISGRLYAALADIGMSHTDAALSFDMAAPLYESAKRFVAAAICHELVAEMRELRNLNSDEARQKAAEAWLKAVHRGKEIEVDEQSLKMAIFRGMWNAHRVGDVQTMISFLELSAEQFVNAGKYVEASDDYVRILKYMLPTFEESDKGGWRAVDKHLDILRDYVKKTDPPSDLLQGLIDLGNDVHENRVLA